METTISPLSTSSTSWNGTSNHTFHYHFKGGLCRLESTTGVYVYAVFLTALALLATIENAIVLIVIGKNSILRQPSIIILGILALVDLITASIVTPIKVWLTVIEAHRGSEAFESLIDTIMTFIWMFYGVVFFSLSTVLMISIDRFLHVFFLEKYMLTTKKLLIGLLVAWCIPLVITIGFAAHFFTLWLGFLALVYFLFCIVGMIAAYIGMVVMLRRHRSKITDTTALCFRKCIEDERRSVNTTLIIMCTCLAMNLPPIVSIAAMFTHHFSRPLCAITFFAMLGNSAVNPVIYCARVPVIRRHVLQLLGIRALRKYEDESDDYLTVVAEGENCNIYTGPRDQDHQEDA